MKVNNTIPTVGCLCADFKLSMRLKLLSSLGPTYIAYLNHGEQGPHELEKSNVAVNFVLFLNQITNAFFNIQHSSFF
jgi:hypothetical protein